MGGGKEGNRVNVINEFVYIYEIFKKYKSSTSKSFLVQENHIQGDYVALPWILIKTKRNK